MINKKKFIFGMLLVCILLINITLISAEVSYCCEKIKDGGAWCMDADLSECATSINPDTNKPYRSVPTSCESTSYCRLGTCIDTAEGTCIENTPQVTCKEEDGGFWKPDKASELPQCQLGCCLIGDQAAFVTQTRCKSLSDFYGLETNYRTDIQSEIQCIASAYPKVKGACVFEKEFQRTCQFSTKKECQEIELSSGYSDVEFHEGYLCSATVLATNCGKSKKTTCVDGKDDVYFLDTCGNLANIYDYSKQQDDKYWTYVAGTGGVEVCAVGSEGCGNCDYLSGTTCKADGGTHVCKDLGCEDADFKEEYKRDPKHGETWCAKSEGTSSIDLSGGNTITTDSSKENLPGSRYFRLVCYNGDVTVEPCADYRQEICLQSEVSSFKTAACRVNIWQDCYSQDNAKDCENSAKRDCKVVEGFSILKDEGGNSLFSDNGTITDSSCVPRYSPGFNFWEPGGDAESFCSLASTICVVDYESGILSKEKGEIVPNEECMKVCKDAGRETDDCEDECMPACVDSDGNILESWKDDMKERCSYFGDCGSSVNYIGEEGFYNLDDLIATGGEEDEED